MINNSNSNSNSMMSPASASANNAAQSPGLKTYFKTPEGKYKLHHEKTYPAGLLHFSHGKTVTQVSLAPLKDKPIQAQPHSTSSFGVTSGVKSAAARLLGGGNGSKSLSFVGGNGEDPIKSIHFSNSNPVCHAFDPDAKEGHDLLIGLSSGDVYSVSLRQQMQDVGKKLIGTQHYNKDGSVNNTSILLYGAECWPIKNSHVQKQVAKMSMQRWICEHKSDKIKNEDIRASVGVTFVVDKMSKARLRWFGHVKKRYADSSCKELRNCERLNIVGTRHFNLDFANFQDSKRIENYKKEEIAEVGGWHCGGKFSSTHVEFGFGRSMWWLMVKKIGRGVWWNLWMKNKKKSVRKLVILLDEEEGVCGRCTSITWVPNSDGAFVVAHADGNFYVYDKASVETNWECTNFQSKDGSADPSFPVIKDQTHFSVAHARYSKNPVARWHICQGSINSIAFSTDGGYLRIFDYKNEQLICGGKSYYGALLCCAWSMDGKYVLAGGEDDLVQVWSMEERKVVAWGEGHNSWVSGVAFDSYWSAPNSDGTDENVVYRFGSVGQDTQLLLWDLEMDEIVVPMRRPHGGSPTYSTGSQSSHWDRACPVGTLQPAPSMRDVPKLSPLVTHRVHTEPLSGVMFTHESVLTICREGHIKVWVRPEFSETQTSNSESLLSTSLKEKPPISGKVVSSKLQAMT
ncbi:hypothetical protein H5410_053205 [Solanum commersonii]|uniref:Nucleotide binding protein n=1 Tax=Solanum commersonii TaxID=4109 RepID=A0A9J5X3S4_SOLCO|nr:hypothetical protein H5410_053205 [Solanum commersonii]